MEKETKQRFDKLEKKVDKLVDQMTVSNKRFDKLIQVVATKDDIAELDKKIDAVDEKVDRVIAIVSSHEERLARIDQRLDSLEERVARIADSVDVLAKSYDDLRIEYVIVKGHRWLATNAGSRSSPKKWVLN